MFLHSQHKRRFGIAAIFWATTVSIHALSAGAVATQEKTQDKVDFSADQVTYNDDIIQAVGRVHLARGGYMLDAGEITYNKTSGQITASGAVLLITPSGNKIYAPHMVLEDGLKKAFIEDIRLLMRDGSQVRALKGNRNDGIGITSLDRAVYSPCKVCMIEDSAEQPLWQIKAVKVIHDKGKRRLFYKDVIFEAFGVPIFWAPKFSHPDPTVKKANGVLPLNIKTTRNLGLYFGVPYHWVLNDSRDVTCLLYTS
ncbi:MAG: hypothetical protein KUG56_08465, partial [Kordiimonadaceae bacterium]|nr:hypothetical protein [Kordiimonadaceae bacterium]